MEPDMTCLLPTAGRTDPAVPDHHPATQLRGQTHTTGTLDRSGCVAGACGARWRNQKRVPGSGETRPGTLGQTGTRGAPWPWTRFRHRHLERSLNGLRTRVANGSIGLLPSKRRGVTVGGGRAAAAARMDAIINTVEFVRWRHRARRRPAPHESSHRMATSTVNGAWDAMGVRSERALTQWHPVVSVP